MKNYNKQMRYAAHAFSRGTRVMAAFDIGKARTRCQELKASMDKARGELAEHVQAKTGKPEDLKKLRDQIARQAQEYSDLAGALDIEEERQRGQVAAQFNRRMSRQDEGFRASLGEYFRGMITGSVVCPEVMAQLGLPITTGENPGNPLLPVTLSNNLIDDLYDDGGFLDEIEHTQIPGLRMAKMTTTDDENDAATPAGQAAHEIKTDADLITWGRFPNRDKIYVPTGVVNGTSTDLEKYIRDALFRTHRARMRRRIFAKSAESAYKHMSVYDSTVGIKKVEGATMLDAIMAALADLPSDVRAVAKVAMSPQAYYAIIRELANGATALFGKPDKAVLGFEAVFCDNAETPLVGDLKTIHCNYDSPVSVKSKEDIDLDLFLTVLGTDYDIQIKDKNSLRLVGVKAALPAEVRSVAPASKAAPDDKAGA